MTKNHQEHNNLSNLGQLILMGAATVLATFPEFTAVVGGLNVGLFCWQKENLDKFTKFCINKFKSIEDAKLDKAALESDDFKSLVLQVVEAATKTHSDAKRQIFANILTNSITVPKSKNTKKQLLFRIIRDLSEEEMEALTILVDVDGATTGYIASQLNINIEDAIILCQGLRQLSLVREPDKEEFEWANDQSGIPKPKGTLKNNTGTIYTHWRVTQLAKELINWCSEN